MSAISNSDENSQRNLNAEWREKVKAMAPAMANTFGQKFEPTFDAFPLEIHELLYSDICTLIWAFIAPITATDENLLAIGADITVKGVAVAVEADALLESDGFYLRRIQLSIGSHKQWSDFLMDARGDGFNVLHTVFFKRTEIPLSLLMEVIPVDATLRDAYLLQIHDEFGSVMMNAAGGDVHNNSQWRLESLWEIAPNICRQLAMTRFENVCPFHNAVRYDTQKPDIDLDSFYETLLKTLPAEELGYDKQTIDALGIPLTNGTGMCSVMHWVEYRTRDCAHREGILSALREALVL